MTKPKQKEGTVFNFSHAQKEKLGIYVVNSILSPHLVYNFNWNRPIWSILEVR